MVVIVVFGIIFYTRFTSTSTSTFTSTINHASTGNVVVTEKFKSEDSKDNLVKVSFVNEPSIEFVIDVGSENVWSLVKENEKYFVLVEWKDNRRIAELNGKTTKLLQIEYLESE